MSSLPVVGGVVTAVDGDNNRVFHICCLYLCDCKGG